MIIIAGRIYVKEGARDSFLRLSMPAVIQARSQPGCRDFVVAPDPLEPDRVNVYEEWESEADLLRFREGGPDDDLSTLIVSASVSQHFVS